MLTWWANQDNISSWGKLDTTEKVDSRDSLRSADSSPLEVFLLASIGIALTPTFLCAMTGMALLVILDADSTLGRKRSTRAFLLAVLISSFAFLCAFLLQLPIHPLVKLILAIGAMLFLLPATFQIALRAKAEQVDRSPLLWRWRCRPGRGGTRQHLMKLDQLEMKLRKQPMDAILHLQALELALVANENSRALYHAHLLDEILPVGSAHAHVLWTTSEILVTRQRRPGDAIPVLRRLDTLYPSYRTVHPTNLWPSQSTTPDKEKNP